MDAVPPVDSLEMPLMYMMRFVEARRRNEKSKPMLLVLVS